MIHAKAPANGLYRSDDAGATWQQVNDQNGTAWYYSQVSCDPTNPEHVITLNAQSRESKRRRQDVSAVRGRRRAQRSSRALDQRRQPGAHDPRQRRRPVHVVGRRPHVGPQREHRRRTVLHHRRRRRAAVLQRVRRPAGQSDVGRSEPNAQHIRADQRRLVPHGRRRRLLRRSRSVRPQPRLRRDRRRAAWCATTRARVRRRTSARAEARRAHSASTGARRSCRRKHDAKTVYMAANYLFKSTDRGDTWETISPDLTRGIDRNKLPMRGGRARLDGASAATKARRNSATSRRSTSRRSSQGVLAVGTDDGLIQVTRDGGKTWTKTEKFPGVPETTFVSRVVWSQAQRRNDLRHARRTPQQRLQAVRREEHRLRHDVDVDRRQSAGRRHRCR